MGSNTHDQRSADFLYISLYIFLHFSGVLRILVHLGVCVCIAVYFSVSWFSLVYFMYSRLFLCILA